MTPALYRACNDALHVITPEGEILRAGRAALYMLRQIGYPGWLITPWTWPPMVWVIEIGYWFVARYRGKLYRYVFRRFDAQRDEPMEKHPPSQTAQAIAAEEQADGVGRKQGEDS